MAFHHLVTTGPGAVGTAAPGIVAVDGDVVTVRLTVEQRAWIIHCLKATHVPARDLHQQEVAVSCVTALGGLPGG